jgi:hypothetical protein
VLVELTSVRVDPGVDFGRADKRAVRFSYGLGGYRSWARSRCHQTLPIDQDVKGAAPSVDFRKAGRRAEGFSYALSEEETSRSWHDPARTSSHQSLLVRFRCSVFVNARELRS